MGGRFLNEKKKSFAVDSTAGSEFIERRAPKKLKNQVDSVCLLRIIKAKTERERPGIGVVS